MPSSPLNPQPSPMAIANSPGPNLGYMHPDSSPFAAMSPAASNWPGSPMPRPSPRPGQSPEHKHQAQGESREDRYTFGLTNPVRFHAFQQMCRTCLACYPLDLGPERCRRFSPMKL